MEAIDLESEELQRGLEADSEESGELSDHDDEDDDGLVKPKRKKEGSGSSLAVWGRED